MGEVVISTGLAALEDFCERADAIETKNKRTAKIEDAEQNFIDAGLRCQEIEEQIASLKDELKDARDYRDACGTILRSLRRESGVEGSQGSSSYIPGTRGCYPATEPKTENSEPADMGPDVRDALAGRELSLPENTRAGSGGSDAYSDKTPWHETPITALGLEKVEGLGKKKRDALIELCPTIGRFEALRVLASQEWLSLHAKLPKGFGERVADSLEELHLEWMRKNTAMGEKVQPVAAMHPRGKLSPRREGTTAAATAIDSATADGIPVADVSALVDAVADAAEVAAESDVESTADHAHAPARQTAPEPDLSAIEDEAERCMARVNWLRDNSDGNFKPQHDRDAWSNGRNAYFDGLSPTDNPNAVPSDFADEWFRGWIAGELSDEQCRRARGE